MFVHRVNGKSQVKCKELSRNEIQEHNRTELLYRVTF